MVATYTEVKLESVAIPKNLKLGPILRQLASEARWTGEDDFPGHQVWANYFEVLLGFIQAEQEFQRFWPRLSARARERTAAFAEIEMAWLAKMVGCEITDWEPERVASVPGDLELGASGRCIFVEVKGVSAGAKIDHMAAV